MWNPKINDLVVNVAESPVARLNDVQLREPRKMGGCWSACNFKPQECYEYDTTIKLKILALRYLARERERKKDVV